MNAQRMYANTSNRSPEKNGLMRIALAAFLCIGLAACHKEGPMEKAGKEADKTTTDVGNAIEDKCEKTKDALGAKDARC
jgi:predicted small lipoprotein YifL